MTIPRNIKSVNALQRYAREQNFTKVKGARERDINHFTKKRLEGFKGKVEPSEGKVEPSKGKVEPSKKEQENIAAGYIKLDSLPVFNPRSLELTKDYIYDDPYVGWVCIPKGSRIIVKEGSGNEKEVKITQGSIQRPAMIYQGDSIKYPVWQNGQIELADKPDKTSFAMQMASQSNIDEEWIEHGRVRGQGAFGKVREASNSRVVKTMRVLSDSERDDMLREREILERLNPDFKVKQLVRKSRAGAEKMVLVMPDKGQTNLFDEWKNPNRGASSQLDDAIQYLLEVDALHEKGLFHCDLKPANSVKNEQGKISIVDMGSTQDIPKDKIAMGNEKGTHIYRAFDIFEGTGENWGEFINTIKANSGKLSTRDHEKVAAFRSVYLPKGGGLRLRQPSALTETVFNRLPGPLRACLDTTRVENFVGEKNANLNEKMLASALAYYKITSNIDQEIIDELKKNVALQNSILSLYGKKDSCSKESMEALLPPSIPLARKYNAVERELKSMLQDLEARSRLAWNNTDEKSLLKINAIGALRDNINQYKKEYLQPIKEGETHAGKLENFIQQCTVAIDAQRAVFDKHRSWWRFNTKSLKSSTKSEDIINRYKKAISDVKDENQETGYSKQTRKSP